jgi:hypothetical protein
MAVQVVDYEALAGDAVHLTQERHGVLSVEVMQEERRHSHIERALVVR